MAAKVMQPYSLKKLLPLLPGINTDMLEGEPMLQKQVHLSVLRLDTIHPVLSGNKLFKLDHYLQKTASSSTVITFGGAFSNHLVATAYACAIKHQPCTGIVRGERPKQLSPTLLRCMEYRMRLHFTSREEYQKMENGDTCKRLIDQHPDCVLIPEGGYGPAGAKGAAQIMDYIDSGTTHICCAIGTATTVAGLLMNAQSHQQIIGIPVLKGITDIEERMSFLTGSRNNFHRLHADHTYHFGGYAKKNKELIRFMNELYEQYRLPTDFVYTAKLMYGIMDMIKKGFFKRGKQDRLSSYGRVAG